MNPPLTVTAGAMVEFSFVMDGAENENPPIFGWDEVVVVTLGVLILLPTLKELAPVLKGPAIVF